ncbi:hypothetical protein CRG98_030032 [Punica granatum]|uniref:Uncharacterized protein n=1 Tax=Punica granatum TaxID=22663 RepID=A0A2I0J1I6_PUNGR|nr:hypothetical protein CRG98_030032 [Punica granatum]
MAFADGSSDFPKLARAPWLPKGLLNTGMVVSHKTHDWIFPEKPKETGENYKEPKRKGRERRQSCTVERFSDRDHLVTGEREGRKKPLECDGTTCRGCGKDGKSNEPDQDP